LTKEFGRFFGFADARKRDRLRTLPEAKKKKKTEPMTERTMEKENAKANKRKKDKSNQIKLNVSCILYGSKKLKQKKCFNVL
jgi:hypothetical protein